MNILLLMSDQHQAACLGSTDHPDALTPHLDQLAAQGRRFDRAYCQDAVCTPSRCSLASGCYPRTIACYRNGDRSWLMDEVCSIQEALQMNGLRTACFGKRHLYQGCDRGWDEAASHLKIESLGDNYIDWLDERGLLETFAHDWAAEFGCGPETSRLSATAYPRAPLCTRASQLPADATMEAWTAQRSCDFIERMATAGQPFYLCASFYRPHQPYTPLPTWRARFDASHWGTGRRSGDGLAKPASFDRSPDGLPQHLRRYHAADGEPWCIASARDNGQTMREYIAAYHALVAEMDHHIGSILDCLAANNLADDTLVIYTTDHGDFVGDHGLAEKAAWCHNVYESTLRVPLIIRHPGIHAPGQASDDLVELIDLYPTIMEACGVTLPAGLRFAPEGRSLLPHVCTGATVDRQIAVCENHLQRTVISHDHKLALPTGVDPAGFPPMLFSRRDDPHELTNRYDDPALADIQAGLTAAYEAWNQQHPPAA